MTLGLPLELGVTEELARRPCCRLTSGMICQGYIKAQDESHDRRRELAATLLETPNTQSQSPPKLTAARR